MGGFYASDRCPGWKEDYWPPPENWVPVMRCSFSKNGKVQHYRGINVISDYHAADFRGYIL
jgi:hypothetical protein